MVEPELQRRVNELDQRLHTIERRLGIPTIARPSQVVEMESRIAQQENIAEAIPAAIPIPIQVEPVLTPSPVPVALPPAIKKSIPEHLTPPPIPKIVTPTPKHQPVPPLAELCYQPAPEKKSAPDQSRSLEQTIGLKWTGWVGAIVLLIGAGLGIRYAYEQGILARVPYPIWLGLIFSTGFVLIGLGEWAIRRVHVVPAASLFGAGVATLFLASYSGNAYYALYQSSVAFTLMALSTLIGAAIARRGKLVSIAVLAIIGGNVTPYLIHADPPNLPGFLIYLGMLQLTAMLLCLGVDRTKWWSLRWVSLATTATWMVLAGLGEIGSAPLAMMMIAGMWYALMFHAEMIATARRGGAAPWPAGTSYSFLVSGALVTFALWLIPHNQLANRIVFIAIEATACAVMGLLVRRERPLAISYAAQACGLAAVIIPVAFSGDAVILGWAVMALILAIVGNILRQPGARGLAVAVWILALAVWIWRVNLGRHDAQLDAAWITLFSTNISHGMLVGWILALIGEAIAWLTMPEETEWEVQSWRHVSWDVCLLSAALWLSASLLLLPPIGATLSIVALAWLCALADIFSLRMRYIAQSAALLSIAIVKWAVFDALSQRLSGDFKPDVHPLHNHVAALGFLLAFSVLAIYFLRRTSIHFWIAKKAGVERQVDFGFGVALAVIGLLALSFCLQVDDLFSGAMINRIALPWPALQMEQFSWTLIFTAAFGAAWVCAAFADRQPLSQSRSSVIGALAILLPIKYMAIDHIAFLASECHPMLGLNLSTLTAGAIAAMLLAMSSFAVPEWRLRAPGPRSVAAAIFILFWAGSFEIFRATERGALPVYTPPNPDELAILFMTSWWALAAGLMYFLLPRLHASDAQIRVYRGVCAGIIFLIGAKYLLVDIMALGFADGRHPLQFAPVLNAQFMGAVVLAIFLSQVAQQHHRPSAVPLAAGMSMMIILLAGASLEIDRIIMNAFSGSFDDPDLALQVALSIFWSAFAVAAVIGGFHMRLPALRYFGLTLFAVTLGKILLVDTGNLSAGYRFLSLLGLGALLMGTSVIYGKVGVAIATSK